MYFVSKIFVQCIDHFVEKKSLACFCFRFFVFLLLFFEEINTPLCEDLYENNSQFRNFIFGTIFGQPHINIDYLWDFLTFMVIFILGGTGHCFSVVEQVFKCWWKKFGLEFSHAQLSTENYRNKIKYCFFTTQKQSEIFWKTNSLLKFKRGGCFLLTLRNSSIKHEVLDDGKFTFFGNAQIKNCPLLC